jgi:hypothetical protein
MYTWQFSACGADDGVGYLAAKPSGSSQVPNVILRRRLIAGSLVVCCGTTHRLAHLQQWAAPWNSPRSQPQCAFATRHCLAHGPKVTHH